VPSATLPVPNAADDVTPEWLDVLAPFHARWWGRRVSGESDRLGLDPRARQQRYAPQVDGFLDSLSVDDRRAAEGELFDRYLTLLSLHGVRGYTVEVLRTECGLALLVRLAGTVGWLSSLDGDLLTERERALQDALFANGRFVAALLDHDVESLLADPTLAP
jgi:hypothetical protein